MVEIILAVSSGGRCGTTITDVSKRIVRVRPAMNAMDASVSRQDPIP